MIQKSKKIPAASVANDLIQFESGESSHDALGHCSGGAHFINNMWKFHTHETFRDVLRDHNPLSKVFFKKKTIPHTHKVVNRIPVDWTTAPTNCVEFDKFLAQHLLFHEYALQACNSKPTNSHTIEPFWITLGFLFHYRLVLII